jgi:hypothetical protein
MMVCPAGGTKYERMRGSSHAQGNSSLRLFSRRASPSSVLRFCMLGELLKRPVRAPPPVGPRTAFHCACTVPPVASACRRKGRM